MRFEFTILHIPTHGSILFALAALGLIGVLLCIISYLLIFKR